MTDSVPGAGIGAARSRPENFLYAFPKKLMRNQMMFPDSEAEYKRWAKKRFCPPYLVAI